MRKINKGFVLCYLERCVEGCEGLDVLGLEGFRRVTMLLCRV